MPPQRRDAAHAAGGEHPGRRRPPSRAVQARRRADQEVEGQAHGQRREQDLHRGDLGDQRLPEQPALPDRGEVGPVGVPAPADPLLDEPAQGVREHRLGAGPVLVHGPVSGREHQPGQPAVVAGDAPPAEEEFMFEIGQYRHHRRAPVRGGAAGHADHAAHPAHRRDVVGVADVDDPIRDPAPHAGVAGVYRLPGAHRTDLGVSERHLHRLEQARLPCGVRVGEHQHLAAGGPDPDPEGGPLALVLEQDEVQPGIVHLHQSLGRLLVADVQNDDHLVRVLGEPGGQAAHQHVRIFPVGRHDHRGGGLVLQLDRLGGMGHDEPDEPDAPGEKSNDAQWDILVPVLS